MRKILLTINGSTPREEVARYALGLAQRLKAKLRILQVVAPSGEKKESKVRQMIRKGTRLFEETMVTATFAEVGEHQLAEGVQKMLAEAARTLDQSEGPGAVPVDYDVTFKVGNLEEEVIRFAKDNRDAVLAVYDGPVQEGHETPPPELRSGLSIPLVSIELKEKSIRGDNMRKIIRSKKSSVAKLTDKLDQYNEAVDLR